MGFLTFSLPPGRRRPGGTAASSEHTLASTGFHEFNEFDEILHPAWCDEKLEDDFSHDTSNNLIAIVWHDA